MTTLLLTYYTDANAQRQDEFLNCLLVNIENKYIDRIILFCDPVEHPPFNNEKVTVIVVEKTMTYTDLFNYGNQLTGIKIIANSDIWFNETIGLIENIEPNTVYAITRWDLNADATTTLLENEYSQDAWIWRDKIFVNVDFGLGVPGCDNVLAFILKDLGYMVINPALSVKIIHFHLSNVRNYKDGNANKYRVRGNYTFCPIVKLGY